MHLGEIRPRDHCDSRGDGVPCDPPRRLSAAHRCALRTLAPQLPGQLASMLRQYRTWDSACEGSIGPAIAPVATPRGLYALQTHVTSARYPHGRTLGGGARAT
eukprot:36784-Rhodomonas_salina.1